MTEDFKGDLVALAKIINSVIQNVNNGGCGYFALYLGEKLYELGYDVDILTLELTINDKHLLQLREIYRKPFKTLKELNGRGGSINHILLRIGSNYIDTRGIYDSIDDVKKYYPEFTNMTTFDLDKLKSLCEEGGWNPMFDTSQLPKMEYLINKYTGKQIPIMDMLKIRLGLVG